MHESTVRRRAQRAGYLVVKSRRRDPLAADHGQYVLVRDGAGNRRAGAQAPIAAFQRAEGVSLDDLVSELAAIEA